MDINPMSSSNFDWGNESTKESSSEPNLSHYILGDVTPEPLTQNIRYGEDIAENMSNLEESIKELEDLSATEGRISKSRVPSLIHSLKGSPLPKQITSKDVNLLLARIHYVESALGIGSNAQNAIFPHIKKGNEFVLGPLALLKTFIENDTFKEIGVNAGELGTNLNWGMTGIEIPHQAAELLIKGICIQQAHKLLNSIEKQLKITPNSELEEKAAQINKYLVVEKKSWLGNVGKFMLKGFGAGLEGAKAILKLTPLVEGASIAGGALSCVGAVLGVVHRGIDTGERIAGVVKVQKWIKNPFFKETGHKHPKGPSHHLMDPRHVEERIISGDYKGKPKQTSEDYKPTPGFNPGNINDQGNEKIGAPKTLVEGKNPIYQDNPLYEEGPSHIDNLLKKRREVEEKRKEGCKPQLDKILNDVEKSATLAEATDKLKKANILLPDLDFATLDDLKKALEEDSNKDQILTQLARHEDTLSLSARKALKVLAPEKVKKERNFLSFKLGVSSSMFALATICGTASIVLTALSLAGIVPGVAAMVPGMVMLGASGVSLVTGMVAFSIMRPNVTKSVLKGTKIRLSFLKIPNSIRHFQQQKKKLQQLKLESKIEKIGSQITQIDEILIQKAEISEEDIPSDLNPLLKKLKSNLSLNKKDFNELSHQEKLEKLRENLDIEKKKHASKIEGLETKLKTLEPKVAYWQQKVERLQDELRDAGAKDFSGSLKMEKKRVKDFKNKGIKVDLYDDLIEGLVEGKADLDEKTQEMLKMEMGIDIKKLMHNLTTDEQKKMVKKALKGYFAIQGEEMTSFINNQKVASAA